MNDKVAAMMPLVDFLGAALGSATEVVLARWPTATRTRASAT